MWSPSARGVGAMSASPSVQQPPDGPVVAAWRQELRIGQSVDALDAENVWREAVVMGLTDKNVRVHFRGFPVSCNKSQPLLSPRFAPAYSRVKRWRSLKKGDFVQAATALHGQKDHVWSNAVVERVETTPERVRVRVRLEGHGEKRWMDTESEFLSMPGTHETVKMRMPREERGDEESWLNPSMFETVRDSLPLWRLALRAGSEVEITDPYSRLWYEGRITGHTRSQVCVRYRGWPWRYDEWLPLESERLAKPRTNLGNWRELELGQELQIGIRTLEHTDYASHWVQGVVTDRSVNKTTQKLLRVEVHWDDVSGARKCEWRDADDDFLAPVGVATYPLSKKTRTILKETTPATPSEASSGVQSGQLTVLDAAAVQAPPRVVVVGSRDQLVEQLKRKLNRMAEDFAELQALVEHVQSTCTCHQVEPSIKRART